MIPGLHLYSREEHIKYYELIKPGHTVCDVGAHIGTHTLRLMDAVGEEGQIIALEPDLRNFGLLCLNVSYNNKRDQDIKLINAALAGDIVESCV